MRRRDGTRASRADRPLPGAGRPDRRGARPAERHLAEELSAVATVESAGTAMVYRVSEQSIRHALDIGKTADALHSLFDKHSKTPVPQGLDLPDRRRRTSARATADRHGRIVRAMRGPDAARPGGGRVRRSICSCACWRRPWRYRKRRSAKCSRRLQDAGFAPAAEDSTGTIVDIRARGARVPAPQRRRPHRPTPRPSSETLSAVVAVLRKVTTAPFGSVRDRPGGGDVAAAARRAAAGHGA